MTNPLLLALVPLVADLSRDLPDDERYRRLLRSLRQLMPCEAVALLKLEGDTLIPLSVEGLSPDTLGRRFKVEQHPRLRMLLERRGPTRSPIPPQRLPQAQPPVWLIPVHRAASAPTISWVRYDSSRSYGSRWRRIQRSQR